MEANPSEDVLRATVQIAAAYLSKNTVAGDQLAPVLRDIHESLVNLGRKMPEPVALPPAVPIRRSVKDDQVTCLECGKPMRMLRRHLNTEHGLSVSDYRAKWGLPPDYPVVAPAYARQRSEAAKRIGLGRKSVKRRAAKKGS